ncbi:MAG: DUF2461 domain-containing protein [Actinomycetota bacterium]|nr:DUF2461 domain-containing protein [Actinomycetota bacterium]
MTWPPEALEFLRDLEDNNDRDWFKANRDRYDEHLVAPGRALAQRLVHLGAARFFRPYNDARFHQRPPIKEQLGIAIGGSGAGAYYVELSLDGLLIGAGLHHPASDQLERFRSAIDDGRRAAAFERAVTQAAAAGMTLVEPVLRRAPRGYPVDHPRLERLRLKNLTVYARHALEPWLHDQRCNEQLRAQLDATRRSWPGSASTSGPRTTVDRAGGEQLAPVPSPSSWSASRSRRAAPRSPATCAAARSCAVSGPTRSSPTGRGGWSANCARRARPTRAGSERAPTTRSAFADATGRAAGRARC